MESHTHPIDSIQLNIQSICIFEYGNQLHNNSTCCGKSVVYMWSLCHALYNFAFCSNWIIQGKNNMEPNTDPRVSIQLNLKPICIFEYGNQWYKNWSCCGKSIVYMWSLCHALYNFAFWSNWIIQSKNDMEPNTDPRVSVLRNAIPIVIVL